MRAAQGRRAEQTGESNGIFRICLNKKPLCRITPVDSKRGRSGFDGMFDALTARGG